MKGEERIWAAPLRRVKGISSAFMRGALCRLICGHVNGTYIEETLG